MMTNNNDNRKLLLTILTWLDWSNYAYIESYASRSNYHYPSNICSLTIRTVFSIIILPITLLGHIFNFINDSIVQLEPSFGNRYFGDTIFKYEIDGDFIRFRNDKFKKEMSFMGNNRLLDLNMNHGEIENIQLIPSNK